MDLTGKTAFVTGGSAGIGRAIVLALAREGAHVAFTYRKREQEARVVASLAEGAGVKAQTYSVDVADLEQVESAVKAAMKAFGTVDILVNNAGINQDGVIWKMSPEQWDAVLDTNLKGCFHTIRTLSPHFRERSTGKIVNITSINGLRGKFGQANYAASKAGIIGLTKSVARELGRFGVNVNAVAPGLIETDMVAQMPQEAREQSLREIVLGRLGRPEDVASVVVFLCTEKARHITGEVIKVDGGQYI
ncbi:MAG: beta-ketoacyl-ACP reductase [Armatimonadetes bacterium]|nr:beta-ketoacyl-ACP reductase [Armatimonadota bacterium]